MGKRGRKATASAMSRKKLKVARKETHHIKRLGKRAAMKSVNMG